MPAADKIVDRLPVSKTGVVNENSVVYSVTLGADVGDYNFNWIGLANKTTGTLAMIIHAPTQRKIKNANGQQGNVLVRSMLMEYSGARKQQKLPPRQRRGRLISLPAFWQWMNASAAKISICMVPRHSLIRVIWSQSPVISSLSQKGGIRRRVTH